MCNSLGTRVEESYTYRDEGLGIPTSLNGELFLRHMQYPVLNTGEHPKGQRGE